MRTYTVEMSERMRMGDIGEVRNEDKDERRERNEDGGCRRGKE